MLSEDTVGGRIQEAHRERCCQHVMSRFSLTISLVNGFANGILKDADPVVFHTLIVSVS